VIEINLLPTKRKKKKAAPGAGFQFRMESLKGLIAGIKNPWLLAASGAWVAVLAGGGALFVTSRARIAVLNSRLEAVQTEKKRFDVVIAQKRQSERIRDSLIAEIGVIRSIDAERYIWPHVLDQLAKALPPYTWLTTLSQLSQQGGNAPPPPPGGRDTSRAGPQPVRVQVTGSTVDIQAYTTFLRQLAASPWFTDVTPLSSQTVVEQDRPVTAFTITMRYKVADSVYIHTVPFTQSLR
jgi:Tfp pilus assembly protein PilN